VIGGLIELLHVGKFARRRDVAGVFFLCTDNLQLALRAVDRQLFLVRRIKDLQQSFAMLRSPIAIRLRMFFAPFAKRFRSD